MKPVTTLLLVSLAALGAACSATVSGASAEAAPAEEVIETAEAGSGVQGTLNLNIGRTGEEPARPIVGVEAATGSGSGLIVAPGSTGGNFEGVEDLGIDIETAPESVLEPANPSDEDEIVRLPE